VTSRLLTGTLVLAALLCWSAGYGSAGASELPERETEARRRAREREREAQPRDSDDDSGAAADADEGERQGSLAREVIRRVIQRHIGEIRQCYEEGLNRDRTLTGRVTVRFIIGADGEVKASLIQETTLGDQRVERCIATAVRSWRFPAPDGGGIVIVNYPFVLTSE